MWVGNRETIILKVEVINNLGNNSRGRHNLRRIKSICKAKTTLNYWLKCCVIQQNVVDSKWITKTSGNQREFRN